MFNSNVVEFRVFEVIILMSAHVTFVSAIQSGDSQCSQPDRERHKAVHRRSLRFPHKMNCYATSGTYHGSPSEAWKNVHAAVASNSKVLMWWSPNAAQSSDHYQWFLGANYVDMVGIDVYPGSGATFASVYGDFYNAFSIGYKKHIAIRETGVGTGDVATKEAWVKQVANTDVSAYPNCVACSWFEFNKGGQDFRVIQGQSFATVTKTLSNFA